MGYTLKRGNSAVPFKELGSSPAKQDTSGLDIGGLDDIDLSEFKPVVPSDEATKRREAQRKKNIEVKKLDGDDDNDDDDDGGLLYASPNKFFFKNKRTKIADLFTGGMASKSGLKPIA